MEEVRRERTHCPRRSKPAALWLLSSFVLGCQAPEGPRAPETALDRAPLVVPNANRDPAGVMLDGVLELELEARLARWKGEKSNLTEGAADPTVVPALAFAADGGPVTVPGPLIRVPEGTEVRLRVRNSIPNGISIGLPGPSLREPGMTSEAGEVLVVRGLRAGTSEDDELRVARGEVGEIRYRADRPGTYFYWATPSPRSIRSWTGIDASLAGAIVVDPAGSSPDPNERIFVITMIDQLPDPDSGLPPADYFRRAINGRSWPDPERFTYAVGDRVRWRWINASFESHPMHLHGFHYRLVGRGDFKSETLLADDQAPLVVTEHMTPGSTFRMEWEPTRAGNWIFHCHFQDHVVPAMERSEEDRAHDLHDVEQHALDAMGGLVLGVTIRDEGDRNEEEQPSERLRLVALEEEGEGGLTRRGFALERAGGPRSQELSIPGPPLLLTRGRTTEIAVVNRMSEPTTIHWHGLELESVYDGVAGWSRTSSRIAPLVAPGDTFAVRIRPPRAGTFIYHTHLDETEQLIQGMAGPFLVLDPGEVFDPVTDRVYLIAGQEEGDYPVTVNGSREAPPEELRLGTTYRLRFVHITSGADIDVTLQREEVPARWRPLAKDGADLPPALQVERDATFRTHTGETYDFEWTPEEAGDLTLSLRYQPFFSTEEVELTRSLRVR
ncbi:MAG TPA: multicopper oxidase domain-containing protein [Thermoanaerobaculia bacterium]|nr:multicopper oxidase domain-containing protein [Thermoanaerobaculia bacterium]